MKRTINATQWQSLLISVFFRSIERCCIWFYFSLECGNAVVVTDFPTYIVDIRFLKVCIADHSMPATSRAGNELTLTTPVQFIPGVGPRRAEAFERLGLKCARDILFFFPRDYQDLTKIVSISELREGEMAPVLGEVSSVSVRSIGPRRTLLEVVLDADGGSIVALWFNQPFLENRFAEGQTLLIAGKVKQRNGRWEITHPHNEIIESDGEAVAGKLLPVYPLTEGVRQGHVRRVMRTVLDQCLADVEEIFPTVLCEECSLVGVADALSEIHFPPDQERLQIARYRLVYQELLLLQLGLGLRRGIRAAVSTAPLLETTAKIDARIRRLFPFELTEGQDVAIKEITADLSRSHPMNRLLQGDVGSGKTVIALYATLLAVAHGYQVAIMAPTEVLARQHARVLGGFLAKSRVRTALLTGSMSKGQRELVVTEISQGTIDVVIGTHALVQPGVDFSRLGLVIIDEQHKFGVRQRAELKDEGPHYLVMTATPIPRTLTMTLFGDLDVSTLRDAPPGRQPINTYLPTQDERTKWWEFYKTQLAQGRQGYVIAPLIEESDLWDVASLTQVYDEISNGPLKGYRIGMLHGKMPATEKDNAISEFYDGRLQVLVSTTVVEVGIDVANASIMTIEGAERFGLAQLHQLRGRIGRGKYPGYCALFGDHTNDMAMERLKSFSQTTNGFELAELDFKARGPGDLFGTRQHGMPPLRIADLIRDAAIVKSAKSVAARMLADDPGLSQQVHQKIRERVLLRYGAVLELGDVG
jgi:ATP-dependent DNA helicase RecG